MYKIKMVYSWGDEEEFNETFETKENAYKKICELVCSEVYTMNEEFEEDRTCTVYFDAYTYRAELDYDYDGENCCYSVILAE